MPKEQLSAFIQVFKEFGKQRVLWKWEGDSIPDLPGNILLQKWLPQNDILAHPNVKMFITHGGLFGSQEGVHYGVPMLGIPFYADQVKQIKMHFESSNIYKHIFPPASQHQQSRTGRIWRKIGFHQRYCRFTALGFERIAAQSFVCCQSQRGVSHFSRSTRAGH